MQDWRSFYSRQVIHGVDLILYRITIYVEQSLCICVLYFFKLYLNHPRVRRIAKNIYQVCYYKGLIMQSEIPVKPCKKFQQFKNCKRHYGHPTLNIIAYIRPWNSAHLEMTVPYSKSIRQQQTGGNILRKEIRITCMRILDPTTGWSEIFQVPRL